MSDARLLVISPPCIEAVNRAVYRVLAEKHRILVHLVVPDRLPVEGEWKDCLPLEREPFTCTKLRLAGEHPRLRRLLGVENVIAGWQPTHILLDGDPAQAMTRQASRAARRIRGKLAEIWVLTAENIRPNYASDLWDGLKSFQPTKVAGTFIIGWLRTRMNSHVDRVFTLSRDGTAAMEASGFRGRTVQIPLGFDPALFHAQGAAKVAATRARLELREKTFAYFGRVIPQKGLHLLIDALATIKDERWQLLLDRFCEHRNAYAEQIRAQIAERGLSDRVVFFNARHDEMSDYMNATDFVALPSIAIPKWKEQYGRVLVEAMACGKIAVASDSGAIPEVLGGCGVIFPEGDVPALAAALRRVLRLGAEELAGMQAKAQQRAHSELTIFNQAEVWAKLVEEGGDGPRGGQGGVTQVRRADLVAR